MYAVLRAKQVNRSNGQLSFPFQVGEAARKMQQDVPATIARTTAITATLALLRNAHCSSKALERAPWIGQRERGLAPLRHEQSLHKSINAVRCAPSAIAVGTWRDTQKPFEPRAGTTVSQAVGT
jgi:hypothetical protein